MAILYTANRFTAEQYAEIFAKAKDLVYPELDALEHRTGYSIDKAWLDDAGRVLCCPFKASPPHWQHGRVIYAAVRAYLAEHKGSFYRVLDIGTAKGFSALCLQRALIDADPRIVKLVTSVDVLPPRERVYRNTVAELDGLKTLAEILLPWPEASEIGFVQSTGIDWLAAHPERIHVAFVDGKHTGDVVRQEGKLLAKRQQTGDLVIFDDCQMPQVSVAVVSLEEWYRIEYVKAEPREYAIARRR
jgi:hypothetical protein